MCDFKPHSLTLRLMMVHFVMFVVKQIEETARKLDGVESLSILCFFVRLYMLYVDLLTHFRLNKLPHTQMKIIMIKLVIIITIILIVKENITTTTTTNNNDDNNGDYNTEHYNTTSTTTTTDYHYY